jgi:hypothetical protein
MYTNITMSKTEKITGWNKDVRAYIFHTAPPIHTRCNKAVTVKLFQVTDNCEQFK